MFMSSPGHGRPSLQFPESSSAFTGCGERFHEIAMMENGRGKERKIIGRPAAANQVREGWKELKHRYSQIEGAINIF
jgi:hypothetical protein